MQSGFQARHSAQTATIKTTTGFKIAIDKKKITIVVLFDFSKAFNMDNQELLLYKMKLLKLSKSAILCFTSYLFNRFQQVRNGRSELSD